MSVKLTKVQEQALTYIPQEHRAKAEADMLQANAAMLEKVTKARKQFSCRISDDKLIVYGLGNRFPVTLRKDGWNTIIQNIEAIKAEVSKLK